MAWAPSFEIDGVVLTESHAVGTLAAMQRTGEKEKTDKIRNCGKIIDVYLLSLRAIGRINAPHII